MAGIGVTVVSAAAATGGFAVNATGLQPGATYSYAAYAANSVGAVYTSVLNFSTLPALGNTTLLLGSAAGTDSDIVVAREHGPPPATRRGSI